MLCNASKRYHIAAGLEDEQRQEIQVWLEILHVCSKKFLKLLNSSYPKQEYQVLYQL